MFIDDCPYTRHGKTYRRVLLRNSYRVDGTVRHDTLANLSQCADEEIEAIKFGLRHKGQLAKLAQRSQTVCLAQGLAVGAVWVRFQLAQSVGLVKALGKGRQGLLCLWWVFATVIAQGSRLSAVRLAQQHAACDVLKLDPVNEDTCTGRWIGWRINEPLLRRRCITSGPRNPPRACIGTM
jgi:hypothetical protein